MNDFFALGWEALGPFLLVCATALIVMLSDLWLEDDEREWLAYFSLAGLAGAFIMAVRQFLLVSNVQQPSLAFNDMIIWDRMSSGFHVLLVGVAFVAILLLPRYLADHDNLNRGELYALMLFSVAGMMLLASARDLIVIFLGIELLSFPLYILAGFARPRVDSEEAALKYFLLGAFASGFLLYGIALIYGAVGSTNLGVISTTFTVLGVGETLTNTLFLIGLALMLVGFGFKISLAPFHQWTPDVYQGAPTPITAFMVAATKAGGMVALMRVLYTALVPAADLWVPILAILAAVTMTWGNVAALVQSNIKRMLAYSSIAHAGYMLIGVLAGSDIFVLLYLLAYALMNLGAFAVILGLRKGEDDEVLELDDFRGLSKTYPVAAVLLSLFLLSLAGFPPTAGFFTKFMIFNAGIAGNLQWLVVVAVLNSVVSVFYYARVIIKMFMQEAEENLAVSWSPDWMLSVALALTTTGVLVLGFYPALITDVLLEGSNENLLVRGISLAVSVLLVLILIGIFSLRTATHELEEEGEEVA
ncbi:NADH-quinone oxidoreductase subunit N [Ardenticatena maritima]|uniref:NADH-quinone oxidoreductase subunit N n=1 Tax=Ardenticatena maritima TaxID=872965 RepID=A0A0M8K7B4_9CHLR|nr:NADH-quinone oxidoreductase subunit N [Ardenticatena maritima]GAP62212.1 NADH-quinone oxidoreductase subunit N [Ardenticatena maritima]